MIRAVFCQAPEGGRWMLWLSCRCGGALWVCTSHRGQPDLWRCCFNSLKGPWQTVVKWFKMRDHPEVRQEAIPGGSLNVAKNQEISGEGKCGSEWQLQRRPQAQPGLRCVCTHRGRICIRIKAGIAVLNTTSTVEE